ncbi:MAG: pilus assembly protein [Alphaproteobacteria bacterium 64-6]|nr:MAG: pilus assembly protein [Alphaproteobacteria bacterium 64-6]
MQATFKSVAALVLLSASSAAEAASLRVSPVTLDLSMPRSSATLTLRNDASQPLGVQIRVFRWTQNGGADEYEPTTAVVASPPSTRLAPNRDYTVRVVRTSKAPIAIEESYRIVIDEIPTRRVQRSGTINLVVRHSIPIFFRNPQADTPKVSWRLAQAGGKLKLVAQNTGGTRLKLADLVLEQGNSRLFARDGLVGYVLAGSTVEWPVVLRQRPTAAAVTLRAKTQLGAIHENVLAINR